MFKLQNIRNIFKYESAIKVIFKIQTVYFKNGSFYSFIRRIIKYKFNYIFRLFFIIIEMFHFMFIFILFLYLNVRDKYILL